jgi:hypothetical protein
LISGCRIEVIEIKPIAICRAIGIEIPKFTGIQSDAPIAFRLSKRVPGAVVPTSIGVIYRRTGFPGCFVKTQLNSMYAGVYYGILVSSVYGAIAQCGEVYRNEFVYIERVALIWIC